MHLLMIWRRLSDRLAEAVPYETAELFPRSQRIGACFVKGKYTVTAGRSLFEAVTALEVLEKSAEIHLKAEFFGRRGISVFF